jgi:hypothetical protein
MIDVPCRYRSRPVLRALVCAMLACALAGLMSAPGASAAARPHLYGARAQAWMRAHHVRPPRGERTLRATAPDRGARALRGDASTPPSLLGGPAAPGPLAWSDPLPVDTLPLESIACPSATLCVAVDRAGGVLWSTDPTGPVRSWHGADVDGATELTSIACPSVSECVAVDAAGNVVSSVNPTGGAAAWTVASVDHNTTVGNTDSGGGILLRGISCPATNLCVAVDAVGDAFFSTYPTGGAGAWGVGYADPGRTRGCAVAGVACQPPIVAVDCPAKTLCVAIDAAGDILTTAAPTAAAPWGVTATPAGAPTLWGLSCPSSSDCLVADGPGGSVLAFNPTAPTALTTDHLPGGVYGMWCLSTQLCLGAAQSRGNESGLFGTTTAAGRRPKWAFSSPGGVDDIACMSAAVCLAADNEGDVVTGVTLQSIATTMFADLLPAHHPSRQSLALAGSWTLPFGSALASSVEVQWRSVPVANASPALLARADYRFRRSGLAKIHLRLTAAGVRALDTGARLTVQADAVVQTATGSVERRRRLVFTAPPKPKPGTHHKHHG